MDRRLFLVMIAMGWVAIDRTLYIVSGTLGYTHRDMRESVYRTTLC